MNYIKKNEKGVTLVELLLAMTLLTIVLITFMAVFTNAFNYNSKTSDKVKGVNLIKEKEVLLKEGEVFNSFIKKVEDGEVSLNWADNPGLNLKDEEDISEILETAKPELLDGLGLNGEVDKYYLLKINDSPYTVFVYVKETPDINNLYRLYIETYDKKDNLLSKTYTYYEYIRRNV